MIWSVAPTKAPAEKNSAASKGPQEFENGPARILIVEDEFLIGIELENRLLDAGFQVVGVAISANEAISLARTERPDLVVMDIRLGGPRDGVDTAIELYSTLGIRSVFASAHADAETRKRATPASPIGWVQKPYAADSIVSLISSYLAALS